MFPLHIAAWKNNYSKRRENIDLSYLLPARKINSIFVMDILYTYKLFPHVYLYFILLNMGCGKNKTFF